MVAISKRPRLKRKERIERKRLKGLVVFELLNTNVDGKKELDESELGRLLELWGMPSNEAVDTITEVLVVRPHRPDPPPKPGRVGGSPMYKYS